MKKALLITLVLLLVSTVAYAQQDPQGWIGLFWDSGAPDIPPPDGPGGPGPQDPHNLCCVPTTAGIFYMYIWVLPGPDGTFGGEFAVNYAANLFPGTVYTNINIVSVTYGSLAGGMAYGTTVCQTNWHWIFSQQMMKTDNNLTVCDIVPHPGNPDGEVTLVTCIEPERPEVEGIVITRLWINEDDCEPWCVDNEESSWGAIKNLCE